MADPKVRPGTMRGWTSKEGDTEVASLAEHVTKRAAEAKPTPLWYVNALSRVPVWAQLAWYRLCFFVGYLP